MALAVAPLNSRRRDYTFIALVELLRVIDDLVA